jgi:pantothenate kinase
MKFRGAPYTFDLKKFEKKIKEAKSRQSFPLLLPSFDHAAKDPV